MTLRLVTSPRKAFFDQSQLAGCFVAEFLGWEPSSARKSFGAASHKGNEWITNGIIKSLKFRDKIYKEMQSLDANSSSYFTTKQNSSVCNQLLKKSKREAKTMYTPVQK